jgi:hypothetical protein
MKLSEEISERSLKITGEVKIGDFSDFVDR